MGFLFLKKEKGIHRLIQTVDKIEITQACTMGSIEVLGIPGMLSVRLAFEGQDELNGKVDLNDVNLFVASGSITSGVEVHTLTSDLIYVIIEANTDDENQMKEVMKKITLYLNEPAVWDGDEITLSRDYEVRISKRHGVLLDCTLNM